MRRRNIVLTISLFLCLSLAGCSTLLAPFAPNKGTPTTELQFTWLQDENGVFQFEPLPLGISWKEARQTVEQTHAGPAETEGDWQLFTIFQPAYTYGEGAFQTQLELENDALVRVRFNLYADTSLEDEFLATYTIRLYQIIFPDLEDLYGPPDSTKEEGETVTHLWLGEEDTMLRLFHGPGEEPDTTRLTITVGLMEN